MPKSPSHVQATGTIPLKSVLILDRLRTEDDSHKAFVENELAPSIQLHGLIEPIALVRTPNSSGLNMYKEEITSDFTLIAGMSRMQAFDLLKYPEIPYCLKDVELSVSERIRMEMEENDVRHPMRWQDRCKGIYLAHTEETKKASKAFKSWTQQATGRLLGVSAATVGNALPVAKFLVAGDEEIEACASLEAAQRVLLGRKQDEATKLLQKLTIDHGSLVVSKTRASGPVLKGISLETAQADFVTSVPLTKPEIDISLSSLLFNEESVRADGGESWSTRHPAGYFDLVFTDHPYGIDMDNISDIQDIKKTSSEHEVDENLAQMPHFIQQSFRLLKPNGYLMFFMDVAHWEKLKSWGEAAGFQVMPYPLLWLKTAGVKNRVGFAWWPKGHEYVMVMRKGQMTLLQPPQQSYFMCDASAERKKYGHPFSKPFEFCRWLLTPVVRPGFKVLDPYAGRGSMVCAAMALGCEVTAVEKVPEHFESLSMHVRDQFKLMNPTKTVNFV